jgi:hypothetical protein
MQELENEVQTLETDAEQQGRHMLSQAQRLEAAQAKWRSASATTEALQSQLSLERALLPADPALPSWNVVAFCDQLKAQVEQGPSAAAVEVWLMDPWVPHQASSRVGCVWEGEGRL